VPAFISGDRAAFVRLMDRPTDDDEARAAIDRLGAMITEWPSLNEFKHFTLDR
jgi:hypothetical protein